MQVLVFARGARFLAEPTVFSGNGGSAPIGIASTTMMPFFYFSGKRLLISFFLAVLTNLAFLVSAIMGIRVLWNDQGVFRKRSERTAYWVMFLSLFAVAIGSSYYHWNPTTTTLFWDRLPMTITLYVTTPASSFRLLSNTFLFCSVSLSM